MNTIENLPIILKQEEFSNVENCKTIYSIGYGSTAIENLNLEQLKQIKLTLDQFSQKESK